MVTKPGSLAIILLVCGQYAAKPFYQDRLQPPELVSKLIALGALVAITTINAVSVAVSDRVNKWFTLFKTAALLLIGALGLYTLARDLDVAGSAANVNFHNAFRGSAAESPSFARFGVATMAALWSYDGWNNLNIVTAELVRPSVNLPRAVLAGTVLVLLAYVFANMGYFAVMHLNQIVDEATGESVQGFATDFGAIALGHVGLVVLPLCIAVSTFGAVLSCPAAVLPTGRWWCCVYDPCHWNTVPHA
eukprot:m.532027 g.532027  ORF g.532027 m.532027 type:complete len:248 (-) comp22041_c1_seq20:1783-2526(-)